MQVKSEVQRLGKVAQCHAVADGIINASDAQTYGNDDKGRGVFDNKEDFERAMPALANTGYYAVLERKDGEVVLYAPYTELKDALGGGRQKNPNAGKNLFSFAKQDPAGAGNNDAAFAEMEAVCRAFTRPGGSVLATMDRSRQWLETKFIHDQTPVFDAVRRVSGNDPLPDRLNVEAAAKNVHGKIRARQEEVHHLDKST